MSTCRPLVYRTAAHWSWLCTAHQRSEFPYSSWSAAYTWAHLHAAEARA